MMLGGVVLTVLWSLLTMQYDRLGPDQASVIQNREVSLIRRSSKYTFQWLTVWDRRWSSVYMEVSLIWRAVIESTYMYISVESSL